MLTPVLVYLPEPIGWIALTPDALREAQRLAAASLGAEKRQGESIQGPEHSECVSAEEAAQVLGVDASWLLRQARLRKIPFVAAGKYRRFDVAALRAHLAKGPQK